MGQINLIGTLKDQDVLRVVRDGSGNPIYLTDMDGNVITPTNIVDTWAQLQAIPKTSGNNNLMMHCNEVGIAGSTWIYKHAKLRWYLQTGSTFLTKNAAAITHTAALTTEESGNSIKLPNDYAGAKKSVMQNGDRLLLKFTTTCTVAGGGDTMKNRFRVGTVTGVTGTDFLSAMSPNPLSTIVQLRAEFERLSATTMRLCQVANSIGSYSFTGTATLALLFPTVTVSDLDLTNSIWINHGFNLATAVNNSNLVLEDYSLELITCGV